MLESIMHKFDNFFCPVCDFVISTRKDSSQMMKYGCCDDCVTYWLEPRRTDWESGWRPSGSDLESYKSRLSRTQIIS
jgi:hypothetical protein